MNTARNEHTQCCMDFLLRQWNFIAVLRNFGECSLYFSSLQNSQDDFKVFVLTVTIRSPRVRLSDTRTVTKKLPVNLLDPIILSLIVWPHRDFLWLLVLSIGSPYIHVKMATFYLSRNMITTRFRQTEMISCPDERFYPRSKRQLQTNDQIPGRKRDRNI